MIIPRPMLGARDIARPLPKISSFKTSMVVLTVILSCSTLARGQNGGTDKPQIKIKEPAIDSRTQFLSQGAVELTFELIGVPITSKIRVKVVGDVDGKTQDVDLTKDKTSDHRVSVNLFKGKNTITLFGFKDDQTNGKPSADIKASVYVTCSGRHCDADGPLASAIEEPAQSGDRQTAPPPPTTTTGGDNKPKGLIAIDFPKAKTDFQSAVIPLQLTITRRDDPKQEATTEPPPQKATQIDTVSILVLDSAGNQIPQDKNSVKVDFPTDPKKPATPITNVKIGNGTNTIMVFDASKTIGTTADQASVTVQRTDNTGSIEIQNPKADEVFQNAVVPLKLKVSRPSAGQKPIASLSIRVFDAARNQIPQEKGHDSLDVIFPKDTAPTKPNTDPATPITDIRIGKGTSTIIVFDASKPINTGDQVSVSVQRSDNTGSILITNPPAGADFQDATVIPITVSVKRKKDATEAEDRKIFVRVLNQGKPIEVVDNPLPVHFDKNDKKDKDLTPKITIGKGRNLITAFDVDDDKDRDSIAINCNGDDCGSQALVSSIPTNSRNTRLVAGIEQVGASSASSETSPFLDLYFNGPLRFHLTKANKNGDKKDQLAQVSTWGQIRLSTTPEQIGAVGAFPSNLANSVSQPGKTTDLIQSFDFLAGLEFKLFSSNGVFPSLIPGVNQKTVVYFVGGYGAISPLSTKKEQAQIYKVPKDSLQRKLFENRFGSKAANPAKTDYIAFVFPERDRFLKQWYVGFRAKTFHCDDSDCNHLANRFPGVFDLMFGQNEAVTGGRWESDFTDENGKLLGRKPSYVFRFDGTFPLPIKQASFLYLYGSAMMKIGGGGVKITTPLFLDAADGSILVTSPKVFVTPTLQLDRDYYKIGVGVNLSDLFNRKTPKQ